MVRADFEVPAASVAVTVSTTRPAARTNALPASYVRSGGG